EEQAVAGLLEDKDPFVRRRAAEALTRFGSDAVVGKLVACLSDDDRFVRYAAMTALAHRPTARLLEEAAKSQSPQALMRLLVA
ncbi:MAG: hypothetical protein GWM87_14290, partial [Xanthomonadales bacterium]|nr:HEAT repeat domain-containing protein [Xanthomonadales bacterium]NIX13978.1 hypothetical protein [Xanthomonadales bacterium]